MSIRYPERLAEASIQPCSEVAHLLAMDAASLAPFDKAIEGALDQDTPQMKME